MFEEMQKTYLKIGGFSKDDLPITYLLFCPYFLCDFEMKLPFYKPPFANSVVSFKEIFHLRYLYCIENENEKSCIFF